ncbi:hypothetical protein [Bradymonas sediminis]|nr:hypothetical protein [Bradymonas sediminis]
MAQFVQYCLTRGRLPGILLGLGLAVVMQAGCVMSPDIEPRDEPDFSPRIAPLPPYEKTPVIEVTRENFIDEIDLSAALYDGNDHRELRYLFLSDERGDPTVASAPLNGKRGDEYYFGTVKLSVNPCTGDVTIPGTEVITLYVSDRGFFAISPNPEDIVAVEGSIMVAYSWTLKYEAGICDTDF